MTSITPAAVTSFPGALTIPIPINAPALSLALPPLTPMDQQPQNPAYLNLQQDFIKEKIEAAARVPSPCAQMVPRSPDSVSRSCAESPPQRTDSPVYKHKQLILERYMKEGGPPSRQHSREFFAPLDRRRHHSNSSSSSSVELDDDERDEIVEEVGGFEEVKIQPGTVTPRDHNGGSNSKSK